MKETVKKKYPDFSGVLMSFQKILSFFCFVFFAMPKKMCSQHFQTLLSACWQGRVGEVIQLLKESPSLLNTSHVSFSFCLLFFVFVFCLSEVMM